MVNVTAYLGQNIKEKRIVITGGTTGIGKAIADVLVSLGGRVLIFGRDPDDFKQAFDDIKEKFPDSELYGASADITNEKDVKRIWKTIDKDLGGIDILINNAALAGDGLTNGTPKEWQYIIDTNVMGYLTFSYEAVERMKKQKSGHIINIGSMSADTQEETGTIYVATKAAIRGFSTALRKEINPLGIKLSLIEPGSVISEIHPMTKTVQRNKIKKMEMLEAEDVAMSVLFCLSQPQRCDIVSLKIRPHLQLI